MKYLIISHAICYDGFASSYVAEMLLGKEHTVDHILIDPDTIPDLSSGYLNWYDRIFCFDVVPKLECILDLANRCDFMEIHDHHKTNQAMIESVELPDNVIVKFDMEMSGASLAFQRLIKEPVESRFRGLGVPQFVKYVEDRDLWKFALPYSKEFHAGLAGYPRDFCVWDKLFHPSIYHSNDTFGRLTREGAAILRFQDQKISEMLEHTYNNNYIDKLFGCKVGIVNATTMFSEVGNELAKKYDVGLVWYFVRNSYGNMVIKVSLRSDGKIDVSEIAKRVANGGGHRSASGFTLDSRETLASKIMDMVNLD